MISFLDTRGKWILLLLMWSTLTCARATEETERPSAPFVTCNIMGQLGNQLFRIATTLAYAWDYGAIPVFPELHQQAWNISYNRDHIFFRLDASASPRPWANRFDEPYHCSAERVPFRVDQCLGGYLQSWKHFHHQREKLLEVFAPSPAYLEEIKRKYGYLLDHSNTVSIHVRTGSRYKHESGGYMFIGLDYYRKAVALFPEDALFVIFSDRINWCKKHFEFCKNAIFIEGNDHITDLYLMSMMKHNINSNSTFSWWGAYLNTHPNKITVVPYPWDHPHINKFPLNSADYFLPDWTVLQVDDNPYYPEDMNWYDSRSQSVDDI